ncbi:MAG: ABC transporter ATP-binding protein [Spirochaetales bacterium]|uniref:ABC transporter ATP-binding protein n=1 Tax=Candidatus Thalassospirochaeta sargassi TaxID=3119039 RepID=A0AAJ1MIQ7_9SPIO|nr:ABC transporter ATP-binding protein [Spirochaetales bacterium]
MKNISKTFGVTGLKANDNVTLDVRRGEIHALVGENGAGKTTLMNILYGIMQPDSGTISLNGKELKILNPIAANKAGIGMVHQHSRLVNEFTVAQNVVLGAEPKKAAIFFDNRKAEAEVAAVIEKNRFHISPEMKISEISVGQMQQVEIIKMLYRKAELLILDEPTSILTEQEIQRLFDTLRELIKRGKTVILITHKLSEVKDISDRITVMRKGRIVSVKDTADVDEREISKMMVGKSVIFDFAKGEEGCRETVLSLEKVSIRKKRQGHPILDNISFNASSCEIVGITGVAGNGLTELEDVIAGLQKISSGSIYHNDEDITNISPKALRERGLAYVPTDRLKRGSSLDTSVKENLILTSHHDFMKRCGVFDDNKISEHSRRLISEYKIDGHSDVPIGTLSGGNIQKVILARELDNVKDFVLFSEPTWGLDVASSEFIYEKMLEMRARGVAVVLISSNIDEILTLADTIFVMYRGRLVAGRASGPDLTREVIGEYMLGLKDDFRGEE